MSENFNVYLKAFSKQHLILLAFAFVYLVWGSNYVVVKMALKEAPPLFLAGVRCLLAGPFLLLLALILRHRLPRRRRDYRTIVLSAFFLLVFASAGVTWAQQWVPSNFAAAVVASSALWLAFFGSLGKRGERLGAAQWASVMMGFGGLLIVLLQETQLSTISLSKILALAGAAISLALGSLIMRRHPPSCSPIVAAGLQACIAGVVLTSLSLIVGEAVVWSGNSSLFVALFYLAILGSGLSYSLYCWLAATVSPDQLASVSYVTPAVAIILAQLVFGETLSLYQGGGVLLIIVAILFLVSAGRKIKSPN